MNRDDIERMAKQAAEETGTLVPTEWNDPLLERFAALVAAAEREACEKACDEVGMLGRDELGKFWTDKCVAAIRARGESK